MILREFSSESLKGMAKIAAKMSALHNLVRLGKAEPGKLDCPGIRFSESPLVALLIIADQLQTWIRQTGQEHRFAELPLECGELSELSYNCDSGVLRGRINYVPYRDIVPGKAEIEGVRRKLQKTLHEDILPTLKKIEFNDTMRGRIAFEFALDGRVPVATWSS